jgi:hypothetical protein
METTHTAASTYVQISREELEDWLDDIGFRGKWERDARFAGVYLLVLSANVAIKLSSTIGSKDDAMGRGQASMQLSLVSRLNGRVLNKKAQGQSHFARTKGWMKNWAGGVDTMKKAYQTASDFYDVIATIDDRDKYREEMLKKIESVPGWAANNFFISLHRKVDRGGVVMPNEMDDLEEGLKAPVARPDPQKTPPSLGEPTTPLQDELRQQAQDELRLNAVRILWKKAEQFTPRDDREIKNRDWVMEFAKSIGQQLKAGRNLSPAQITVIRRNLDQWDVKLRSGKPASTLF